MYFLSLETSTKIFSLAVSRDEKVLRFRNMTVAKVLENSIIGAIDKLLDSAGAPFEKLDGFCHRPRPWFIYQSEGRAFNGQSSLHGHIQTLWSVFASLDVIAAGIKEECDEICVINDARRGKVYAAIYAVSTGRSSEYLLTTMEDVLNLKVHAKTLFVGDALPLYSKDIARGKQERLSLPKKNFGILKPRS